MRSVLVMILAAGAFGAFLYRTHSRAADQLAAEQRALEHLLTYAAQPAQTPPEERDGYRFSWILGGELPGIALARPLRPDDPHRWFATPGGGAEAELYEFDLVLYRAPRNQPDLDGLRAFLARPEAKREEQARPFGWRRVG